jgi:protein involved in polysaccharide export with SLBB domain/DNA-binding protein H-NS
MAADKMKLLAVRLKLPIILSVCLLPMLGEVRGAEAQQYRLGPQDKVRVKAYEWRATRDQMVEWKALNDEFIVGANGMLSIPFGGQIPAAGATAEELAGLIADRVQTGMGLGRAPDISVEVVQFRPFHVVGYVERPGEYPYRPALTVLKALGIAGGLQRLTDPDRLRLQREAISTRGELDVFRRQADSLLARKARLDAELRQADPITFPNELTQRTGDPSVALILEQEQMILGARQEAFRTQKHALEQLKKHLEQEIALLHGQIEAEDTQIRLVKKELETISALAEKGLSSAPRLMSLQRTLAQLEGDRLRLGTALLRAKQEISKTDIALLDLRNKRTNEATTELRETQAKLEEINRKLETADELLHETEAIAPLALASRTNGRRIHPVYVIMRRQGQSWIELDASESTAIEPGDTIKVELPPTPDATPAVRPARAAPAAGPYLSQDRVTGSEIR